MTEKLNTEIRREQIIKVAVRIIQKKGLKSLTIQKIASAIGIVPSNVYRHFSSKGQIVDAVLDFISFRLSKNVETIHKNYSSPINALRVLLMNQVEMMLQVSSIFPRILLSDEVFVEQPKRKQKVYAIFNSYLEAIDRIIKRGQEEKTIRSDISPRSLSVMFLGLFQPSSFFYLLTDGNFDIKKQVEDAWQVFVAALKY